MNYRVNVLGPEDNRSLLKLTEDCTVNISHRLPLPGTSILKIERSPDYFAFLRTISNRITVLGIFKKEVIIATVSLIEREVMWETKPLKAYYICDLKVHPKHRNSFALFRLLKAVREHLGSETAAYAYTLERNKEVSSILTGRVGLRNYRRIDNIYCFTLFSGLPVRCPRGYQVREITSSDQGIWNEYFSRWSRGLNLVPVSLLQQGRRERHFMSLKGNRIVAIGSLINQTDIRRVILNSLSFREQAFRWAANSLATITGVPHIPGVGQVFSRAYLGNLVYDDNHQQSVNAILAHCQPILKEERIPLLCIGLSERDPALSWLSRWKRFYQSCVMLMATGFPSSYNKRTFVNLHEI